MIALTLALALSLPQPLVKLVENSRSAYSIVVAPGASLSMRHGAEELQHHIQLMSGVKLPIIRPEAGWSEPDKHLIVIADDAVLARREKRTPLGDEEYRIQTNSYGLLISGGAKRGAMYGCYALLEDVLGVHWYNTRSTKIPKRKTITIPKLDVNGQPAFEYREPFFTEAFDKDWAARNRTNGNSQRLDATVGGKVAYGAFVHTFAEICPPGKFFATHPEYFSMIDGQRKNGYFQLCLTNPDVVKLAIAQVEEWIKRSPDATIFSVSQNDTYYNCQCPACAAVEKEEGAPSGPLIRFVNQVAEAVEQSHPNVLIDTLAYQWSEKPPLHVRPRKNVRIRIAPIGACFGHPLDGCAENKLPMQNLKDWAKITSQIYIWHYSTNFANYLQPLPNLDEIAGDVKLFKANGVVGFFDEGDYAPGGGGEMSELKAFLLAKLMWDPNRDPKAIIDDYVAGVYRKAGPMMAEWLDLIHESTRAGTTHPRIYDPPTAPYLSDELLSKGTRLFDRAERNVVDDPKALDEVQRARLALDYVRLMRTDRKSDAYAPLARNVARKIRRYGIGQTSEGRPSADFLKQIGQ